MGKVSGDLDELGLENLFQALANRKAQGVLSVHQQDRSKTIELGPDGIRLVRGGRASKPLGEILIRAGKITPEQLEEFLAEQRTSGVPLGEIVAGRGIVPREVIQSALRKQVAEEIHELFTWTGASFEFQSAANGQAPADQGPLASVVLDANIMSIMLEAARRVDELENIRSVIPDERLVPEILELPGALDDPGLDRHAVEEILLLVDGQRSVGQIVDLSLYPQFTVLRTLYGLSLLGVLKIQDRTQPDQPVTVIRRAQVPEKKKASRGRGVLLLTDAAPLRRSITLRLLSAGFEVTDERPGADLAKLFSRSRTDAVIADVPLGTPEGAAVCAQIRQLTRAPFIVVTESRGREALTGALDSGARFVLLKPLDEPNLLERVQALMPS